MTYKITPNLSADSPNQVTKFLDDGLSVTINLDVESSLRDEYLAWLAEGNTPADGTEVTWDTIRAKRDQLIAASDWTMIPGATVDQAQWSAYRQILRDLPQTYSNPEDVVWPTAPSTSGPNTIEE